MTPAIGERPIGWARVAPGLLLVGSVFTAPLFSIGRLTLTGDRVLGLAALAGLVALAARRELDWTPIHSALAVFAAVQLLTTVVNLRAWPAGLKFATVYWLGFACYAVAAGVARSPEGRDAFVSWWIAVGACLGAVGALLAVWANLSHTMPWGTEVADRIPLDGRHLKPVFAGRVMFRERNLFSSFLLIPYALSLWRWRTEPGAGRRRAVASLAAIVLGLVFGFTRAAWIAMAGIAACWWWTERPAWRRVGILAAIVLSAFVLQAAVVGDSAIRFRVVQPIATGHDRNLAGRVDISEATIASWRTRPVLGHGAGSINGLSLVRPSGRRVENLWNGNMVLFVLHDSGLIGLAALVWLAAVVVTQATRRTPSPLVIALLAAGGALCFAYQFTHGLWLMYPYVYLGVLAAAARDGARAVRPPAPGPARGQIIPGD